MVHPTNRVIKFGRCKENSWKSIIFVSEQKKDKWTPAVSIMHTETRTSNALRLSTKVILLFIISFKSATLLKVSER